MWSYIGPEAGSQVVIVRATANPSKALWTSRISQAGQLADSLQFMLSADSTRTVVASQDKAFPGQSNAGDPVGCGL